MSSAQLPIDGTHVDLQVWESPCDDAFTELSPELCHGAECCILVYSATDMRSFESMSRWRKNFCETRKVSENRDFPFLLLATESERYGKVILPVTAKDYAERMRMLFSEVSGKTCENVGAALTELVRQVLRKPQKAQPEKETRKGVRSGCSAM
jgi:GTPase SAR1 family protein